MEAGVTMSMASATRWAMSKHSRSPARTAGGVDIEALYVSHRRQVLRFLARRTADPQIALDLWAETFAQSYAKRHTFRGTTDAEAVAWLMSIARRQLAQFYRRGQIEQRGLNRLRFERPPASADVLADIATQSGLDDIRRELAVALARLSPAVREAVQMRVVDELEYPVLASQLGISEGTARVRVSRGLATLAELLDQTATKAIST
jgi:RNA polymerase sigma-70 factor (ECF subfamily)